MERQAPEVVPQHSGLEVAPSQYPQTADASHYPSQTTTEYQYQQPYGADPNAAKIETNGLSPPPPTQGNFTEPRGKRHMICGLTVFQAVIAGLLLIAVIVGAVLGGIFGSGVLRKGGSSSSNSVASDNSVSLPHFSTQIITRTQFDGSTFTFPSATGTSDSFSSTETGISASHCPNNTLYTTTAGSVQYSVQCSIDWPAGPQYRNPDVKDVYSGKNFPTLKECMEACSTWDDHGDPTQSCRAVVWNYGFQCYLKNQTGPIPQTFYNYEDYFIQAAIRL